MSEASSIRRLRVPLAPAAKARPRVTSKGTYMPRAYQEWRQEFRWALIGQDRRPIAGLFAVRVVFTTPRGTMRPDLDNALAAVLDALQDDGAIANDRNCRKLSAEVVKGRRYEIGIELEELA